MCKTRNVAHFKEKFKKFSKSTTLVNVLVHPLSSVPQTTNCFLSAAR